MLVRVGAFVVAFAFVTPAFAVTPFAVSFKTEDVKTNVNGGVVPDSGCVEEYPHHKTDC